MAPILERYLKHRATARKPAAAGRQGTTGHKDVGTGPAILLVAPTKALCNDLFRRLKQPVSNVGLEIALRTGDNPNFKVTNPPQVVITTPESLDSLIARKPASFLYLEAIIIDEIHLIHANGRGDQLQCLIARLRILNRDRQLQICASSATVPEIERIAADFLGANSRTISCPAGTRDIRATIEMIPSEPKAALAASAEIIRKLLQESPTRKLIAFCNSRTNVENIVRLLRNDPHVSSIVFAHHGSLSKEERLRTEQQFLRARNAACVATSTLELGIDIGDVDMIVLLGPPPDVSSLIQRIGRGSRTLACSQVNCLADCEFSAQRFLHLVSCARKEMLFPDPVEFRPATVVQQALSICLQNPQCWVGKQALYDRLAPASRKFFSPADCGTILEQMTAGGLLRKVEHGRYVPENKAQFLFSRGYMHSMIADRSETDVVDSVTGRTLGSIYLRQSSKDAIATGAGVSLTLAGNSHTVSYMKDKKLFVKRGAEAADVGFLALEPPRYSLGLARDFATFMHVPTDALYIRCIPAAYDLAHDFSPDQGSLLRRDIAVAPENVTPGCEYFVHHFLGTVGSLLLQNFFEKHGNTVKKASRTPFFMRLLVKPTTLVFPDEEKLVTQFELYVRANVQAFAKLLQPGPWFNLIPEEFALRWLLASIDLRAYARVLADLPIALIQL